jgi:hypothetical protein
MHVYYSSFGNAFLFGHLNIDWFSFIQAAFCFSVQALLIVVHNGRLCGEGELLKDYSSFLFCLGVITQMLALDV